MNRRKLIEVDLPLDDINREAAREKSIRHGHPSTLHLWWARRPLAACRAVIFASLVDDPSACPDEFPSDAEQAAERKRLHDIISELVKWKNTDESRPEARDLLNRARYEIARSVARTRGERAPSAPAELLRYLGAQALSIYDPFAGGGSIPLEAQRLGLRAIGTDLNPVAVLINKALIELPPKFAGQPPVNPGGETELFNAKPQRRKDAKNNPENDQEFQRGSAASRHGVDFNGAAGLAADIRYYGRWMREEAFKRIGHLYPKIKLSDGSQATVVAWLWARTVPCPNPACGVPMPLMKTFQLSKKAKNQHWTRPTTDREARTVSFVVQNHSDGVPQTDTVNRNGAFCVACGGTARLKYVREQSRAGNMGEQMTAIVAEGDRRRLFLSPTEEHIKASLSAAPSWHPNGKMPNRTRDFTPSGYGITHWHQLFSERQLTALTTFSDLLAEARTLMTEQGADEDYANAVCTYLALVIGRVADRCSSFASWAVSRETMGHVFTRQAIPMVWDFAEASPFSTSTGNWMNHVNWVAGVVERLPVNANGGTVYQADASTTIHAKDGPVIVTDPPYYDNIAYADLSDFFYVWIRPLLRDTYPELFAGMTTPKEEEMIAEPQRFDQSRQRFEEPLRKTLKRIRERCTDEFPSSIFYAYKQQEEERQGRASTGWETMLTAIVQSGFQIVGNLAHTYRNGE